LGLKVAKDNIHGLVQLSFEYLQGWSFKLLWVAIPVLSTMIIGIFLFIKANFHLLHRKPIASFSSFHKN